jgi:carbamoyl-phosphate synthase small subunit
MNLEEHTMSKPAYLILENGATFKGEYFGAIGEVTGELVFTTGMTGYLETLTDPNYHGQIVLHTFPLIGNYGIIPEDFESPSVQPAAYIVKHPSPDPSNFRSEGTLEAFMSERGLVGVCHIDTRALTKIIREHGVMNARITATQPVGNDVAAISAHHIVKPINQTSCKERSFYAAESPRFKVALLDFGCKESIKRALVNLGCELWVLPGDSTASDILSVNPDGVVLSNGPGDPMDNPEIVSNLQTLIRPDLPMFGFDLGHQLLALAFGFTTSKLKYGHRGANQPVRDKTTGQILITSQNHGYVVNSASIDNNIAEEWFINANDKSCEGISYIGMPLFSVQFNPSGFLFDRFIRNMEVTKHAAR